MHHRDEGICKRLVQQDGRHSLILRSAKLTWLWYQIAAAKKVKAKKKDMIGLLEAWEVASQAFCIMSKEIVSYLIKLNVSDTFMILTVKNKSKKIIHIAERFSDNWTWKFQLDSVWYHLFLDDAKSLWSYFSSFK
jgi:hypothetical protein